MAEPHVLTGLSKRHAELLGKSSFVRLPTGFVGHGGSRRGDSPRLLQLWPILPVRRANPGGQARTRASGPFSFSGVQLAGAEHPRPRSHAATDLAPTVQVRAARVSDLDDGG